MNHHRSVSDRVNGASGTEAVDFGAIPGRVKSKTIKIGIRTSQLSYLTFSNINDIAKRPPCVIDRQSLREGGSRGTSYPGPGRGGPGRVEVVASSFGPTGPNLSEHLFFLVFT